jgi:hypothetical protein
VALIIVEASGSVATASSVNFDTATSRPARPEQYRLAGEFMEDGGMRFCANQCNGDVVDEKDSRYSVTCWTSKVNGVTYCPGMGEKDTDKIAGGGGGGVGGGGSDGDDGSGGNDGGGVGSLAPSGGNQTDFNDGDSGGSLDDKSELVLYVIFAVVGVLVVCCVGVVAVVVHRRRGESETSSKRLASQEGLELSSSSSAAKGGGFETGKKRQTVSVRNMCGGEWSIVIDPESGDQYYYNSRTQESQWDPPEEIRVALETSKRNNSRGGKRQTVGSVSGDNNGEWYPFQTADGHTAFAHSVTGEVTWDKPEGFDGGLAGGRRASGESWSPFETDDGFTAYRNDASGEVSWTNPVVSYDENPIEGQRGHLTSFTKHDVSM